MNVNVVFFGGNLTRDPELRHSGEGLAFAKFGVACNEYAGKDKTRTTFVDVVAFGKRGEAIAKHFKKGAAIFIRGRLSFSSWTTTEGAKRSKLEVVVDDFQFVGKKDEGPTPSSESTKVENIPF